MNTYLKFKSAWLQLLIFGSLTFGMSVALIGVGLLIVSKIYNIPPLAIISMDVADPNMLNPAKALQVISSIAIFLAPSLVFAYLSDRKPMEYIGFKKPSPPVFWGLSFLLIFASLPMVGWLGHMNENMHLPASMASTEKAMREAEAQAGKMIEKFLEMKSPADLIKMIFIVALVPAFAEELFFRGVLQRLMIQITRRPITGIIITAIIFSAIHGQFLGFFPRMVLGILLGALFWYSGSLWPGILAHFVFNGAQVVLVYLNPKYATMEPQYNIGLIVGSTFFVLLLLYWMKHISHTHYAVVYDTDDEFTIERGPDQSE